MEKKIKANIKKSDANQLLHKEYSKETRVEKTDNSKTAAESEGKN